MPGSTVMGRERGRNINEEINEQDNTRQSWDVIIRRAYVQEGLGNALSRPVVADQG